MSRGRASLPTRLAKDENGATIVEFAIVGPVFLLLLMGTLDLGQTIYAKSVLEGAVQKAARDSALETASTLQADNKVKAMIEPIVPGASLTTSRTSYYDFVDVGRPERWNDANNNGTCDNHESYVDENNNSGWDSDIGLTGNGGASDVIIYTVDMEYESVFRVPFMPEGWGKRTLSTTAVRKNQPFSLQTALGSSSGTC